MNRKRILVYGDSNSWGFVPCGPNQATTRYDTSTRWPAVMACQLGDSVELVEEALSGRTTDLDDFEIDLPSEHLKGTTLNGAKLLPAILSSHLPLDLVIIMLGSNDLKTRFNRSPQQIATAVAGLARLVDQCKGGVKTVYPAPKVLLVAPPPLGTGFHNPQEWAGGPEKSLVLGSALRDAAAAEGLAFLDAGQFISTEGIDGIHLTPDAQRKLGEAMANKLRILLQDMGENLMATGENKAVISSFVEDVLNQGRLERVDDLVAVDFVEVDPRPGQQQGREGLKQVISAFRTAFPDIHWVIEEMVGEGEKVFSRFTWRGTHRGEFFGIPATGKQITVKGMVVDRVVANKMMESQILMDGLSMMRQLGVVPG